MDTGSVEADQADALDLSHELSRFLARMPNNDRLHPPIAVDRSCEFGQVLWLLFGKRHVCNIKAMNALEAPATLTSDESTDPNRRIDKTGVYAGAAEDSDDERRHHDKIKQ